MANKISIPSNILKDSNGRYVLDSYSKVIEYILCTSKSDEINLSNCILIPSSDKISFSLHDLYNYAKSKGQNTKIGIIKKRRNYNHINITKRFVSNNSIIRSAFLSNTTFEQFATFGKSVLEDIHFTNSIFSKGLDLTKCTITGYLTCNGIQANSVYLHSISYEGSMFDLTSSKIKSISILSSTFKYSNEDKKEAEDNPQILHTDLNFALSNLGDVFISNTNSELFISFLNSHITDKIRVFDCELDKGLIFEGCRISGNQSIIQNKKFTEIKSETTINFDSCKLQSELVIIGVSCDYILGQDCTIEKTGRLSVILSATNHIYFERMSIYGELNVNHINPKESKNLLSLCEVNMECAINLGNINFSLENLKLLNFDTAKLLRLAAQKLNNSIEVTTLKAIEHKLFLKENKCKFSYNSLADHMLLWLNRVSNNFGTNWLTGCLFCVIVSIIFISLIKISLGEYIFTLNPSDWAVLSKDFWINTFEFLWLPNLNSFSNLTDSENCTPWTIIFFIIGKSLIAYGIFQTVVAFRKYNSK